MEVDWRGEGLHWEALDEDISVPRLPGLPATSAMLSSDANLLALGVYDSVPIRTPAQFLKDYGQA